MNKPLVYLNAGEYYGNYEAEENILKGEKLKRFKNLGAKDVNAAALHSECSATSSTFSTSFSGLVGASYSEDYTYIVTDYCCYTTAAQSDVTNSDPVALSKGYGYRVVCTIMEKDMNAYTNFEGLFSAVAGGEDIKYNADFRECGLNDDRFSKAKSGIRDIINDPTQDGATAILKQYQADLQDLIDQAKSQPNQWKVGLDIILITPK